jgi:hypothetical protein
MRSAAIIRLELDPVTDTQRVTGVVEYIRPAPVNPKTTIGRGLSYTYDVRLEDDTLISIDDDVGRPHLVESVIPIERQHHKHSADTYRLLNG